MKAGSLGICEIIGLGQRLSAYVGLRWNPGREFEKGVVAVAYPLSVVKNKFFGSLKRFSCNKRALPSVYEGSCGSFSFAVKSFNQC